MVTKYDTRKKYLLSNANVAGNKYKKFGPGSIIGREPHKWHNIHGFVGGRDIEAEGGKYDNNGNYVPDKFVRDFNTDKRAAVRAMNPKTRVRNFMDDGFTREKAEKMVKESPIELVEYRRSQGNNPNKKRQNTPYRGGKIAYKFGNSMDAKYVNRKQKTNTIKRKPATKRKITRVKHK